MSQSSHLDYLELETRNLLEQVRADFAQADAAALSRRPSEKAWNALECFAHLNAYCDYYFPKIELAIHKAKARQWQPDGEKVSNWLGAYSIRFVDPANMGKGKKKTSKRYNFKDKPLRSDEVKAFLINCEMMLRFIRNAREVDINKAKVPFAQFKLFKLRLCDIMEFLVVHAKRHLIQAEKASGLTI